MLVFFRWKEIIMKDKTGRLIIKVIYISFALIIVFFSSIVLFNTAKGDHIINVTNKALQEKDYNEILSLFCGIYYEDSSVTGNKGDTDLIVNPSYVEKSFYYTKSVEDGKTETHFYHKFLKSYSFFIFNSNFATTTRKVKGENINEAGIKFILDKDGETVEYNYPFVISSTVNTTKTFDMADSVYDYELNYKRDIITDQQKYGFYNFTINSNTIEAIEDFVGGEITGFNVVDSSNKNVFDTDFNFTFDFAEPFYMDEYNGSKEAGVIEKIYNSYIPYYDSYKVNTKKYVADNYVAEYNSKTLYSEKNQQFDQSVSQFIDKVKNGTEYDSKIKVSKTESEIITNSVIAKAVWRTIGIEALVLLVIAVIYILLFHFQQLRDFIFRNDRRTPIRAKVQNKEPEQQKAKFNYNQSGNKVIDVKPEPVEEAPVEEPQKDEVEEAEAIYEETKENTEE